MGHSTSRAALVYLHSTDGRQRELAEAVAARARSELGQSESRGTHVARPDSEVDWVIGTHPFTRDLNWAFMGAPSATRTRDLLLRRHFRGAAR